MKQDPRTNPSRERVFPLMNAAEANFEELAFGQGWHVTKRGWPDFLCFPPGGEPFAVEVKPRTKRGRMKSLKPPQVECLRLLSAYGIACYVSDGQTLERFDPAEHVHSRRKARLVA